MIASFVGQNFPRPSSKMSDRLTASTRPEDRAKRLGEVPNASLASANGTWSENTPTAEELEVLAAAGQDLERASPEEIIAWAVAHYFPRLTMATAFGPEGCVILAMLAKIEPRIHVFNLDTGYQFRETLELRDRIADRYGIAVHLERPELSVVEYEACTGDRCTRPTRIDAAATGRSQCFTGWQDGLTPG